MKLLPPQLPGRKTDRSRRPKAAPAAEGGRAHKAPRLSSAAPRWPSTYAGHAPGATAHAPRCPGYSRRITARAAGSTGKFRRTPPAAPICARRWARRVRAAADGVVTLAGRFFSFGGPLRLRQPRRGVHNLLLPSLGNFRESRRRSESRTDASASRAKAARVTGPHLPFQHSVAAEYSSTHEPLLAE